MHHRWAVYYTLICTFGLVLCNCILVVLSENILNFETGIHEPGQTHVRSRSSSVHNRKPTKIVDFKGKICLCQSCFNPFVTLVPSAKLPLECLIHILRTFYDNFMVFCENLHLLFAHKMLEIVIGLLMRPFLCVWYHTE